MNILPHKISREHTVEPLHQLLLNFGKGLWQRPLLASQEAHGLPDTVEDMLKNQHVTDSELQVKARELTIRQVATMLRMQQDDHEELAMLDSIESLALAGEITFSDYIGRLQNLHPKAMVAMDVSLRMKVASFMI